MLSAVMRWLPTVAAVVAVGCAPAGRVRQSVLDSVLVRETVRDTVIELAPDSSLLQALIECDSLGQARLSRLLLYEAGERMGPPAVTISDNVLTAKVEVDSLMIYAKLRDRYMEHRTVETVVETVETNTLTAWQKLRLRLGEAMMAVMLFCIMKSVKKVKDTLF